MRGILVTLLSVTALVGAATLNTRGCHKDPSEASSICKATGSEGVLVAHEKCNKFYKCSHGRPVSRDCPIELLYNPDIESCDWPKNVECGNRIVPEHNDHDNESVEEDKDKEDFDNSGHDDPSQAPAICSRPKSDGALIAHEYCTQFYKCFQGHPVALKCPLGLYYNAKTQQCDWPTNVQCGERVIPVEDDNGSDGQGDESIENDKDADGENVDEHEDEGYPDPSQAPTICAKEDSDSKLIAHELCNHFYICLHKRTFPVICPPGLHFEPKSRKCEWPHKVDCGNRVIPKEKNDTEKARSEEDKEIYDDPSKAPEICAEHESVLVAHEYCNYFYQCAGGKPVARKCPPGLVYNYNIEQCDWPSEVVCGNRVISVDDEDSEEPEEVTEKDVAGHDDPSKAPIICNEEGSDGVLVAHEICNKYYICASGIPVPRPCPKGLLYNPNKERCDWPDVVTCGNRLPPVDHNEDCDEDNDDEDLGDHEGNYDPSKAPEICSDEKSDGILIAHEYCDKFYICVNNHPVSMKCPNNLLFNPRLNKCDWAANVKCWGRIHPKEKLSVPVRVQIRSPAHHKATGYDHSSTATIICSKDESDSLLLSHKYCNKFYQCVGYHPVELSCPSILHFNPEGQHCDWPENVDCNDRIIPEDKEDDADNDESDEKDDEPVGNNFDDPSQAPAICAKENSNGIFVAHEYCNKFYICVNNSPLALECPENLWYNPKIDRCDWQKNVQCNGRVQL